MFDHPIAVVRQGTCTSKLLQVLVGCWIHVLLFRRSIFAVLNHVFNEGKGRAPNEVFCLYRESRSELQLIACLGPLAQSDLRATYSSHLFCTDASPSGGAVIRATISKASTEELWRHTEQRGFYTRLLNPAGQILHEKGIQTAEDLKTRMPVSTRSYS